MRKVAPTSSCYRVHRHGLAWFLSIASLFNVSSMPLTAYLSEYLPWVGRLSAAESYANYTTFSTAMLAVNQQLYSSATLPRGVVYLVDDLNDAQVARALLPLAQPPMDANMCFRTHLLGLPGLIYYTGAHVDLLCSVLQLPNTSSIGKWANLGSCFHAQLITFTLGRSCLWVVPGDAIHNTTNDSSDHVTVYFAYWESRYESWVWFKFVYRICATLFVWNRLWRLYYRHVFELEARLQISGHRQTMPEGAWSYQLVVGDPTTIILMDPWVASLYFLDIWLSVTNLAIAIMQVTQNGNAKLMLLSMSYLARTVWFAYWGLCLVSFGLKRWQKEHIFGEVDPTLVAIAVTIYGPVLTWMNGHVEIFTRIYRWTFYCLLPAERRSQEIESALGCVIYAGLITCIPLLYGLIAPHVPQFQRHSTVEYSSFHFNNVKTRVAFGLARALYHEPRLQSRGGNLHRAFAAIPRLKQCPTISLRSTDCFVLCYCDGHLHEKLRLSLLDSLDRTHTEIPRAATSSEFVVNVLAKPDGTLL
ncbi:hypothetical protein SDRG_11397 [Saprolegnia diclina VS20]|uniref:Uncharacterized protein n=1 Tax=Saprolegnia diclina (strain VS20) TaxID=1156394 RepID=T0RF60_SAPDV|nr:hypothetical protein SDRG_11397 [Saprolegnia diclina VS20]EQC30918.1 hypothetical protein SDRG_11397 [Saprolegnia diclina VS20]|eukprot:XP_008615656.1 hypothetical protein SDRG_11397 [Saprolegnia diclina VS20]